MRKAPVAIRFVLLEDHFLVTAWSLLCIRTRQASNNRSARCEGVLFADASFKGHILDYGMSVSYFIRS